MDFKQLRSRVTIGFVDEPSTPLPDPIAEEPQIDPSPNTNPVELPRMWTPSRSPG
jgi:hypothetical protein